MLKVRVLVRVQDTVQDRNRNLLNINRKCKISRIFSPKRRFACKEFSIEHSTLSHQPVSMLFVGGKSTQINEMSKLLADFCINLLLFEEKELYLQTNRDTL